MLTLTCFSQAGCRYAKEVWKRGLYRTMHTSRQPDPWGGKTGCHLYLSPVYISFEHFLHFMSSRANWKNSFQLLNYWKNYKSQRDLLGSYPSMCWPKCWELNMLFLSYSQGSYCCLCSQSSPDDITPLTGRIVLNTSSPAKAIVNTHTQHKLLGIPCHDLLLYVEVICLYGESTFSCVSGTVIYSIEQAAFVCSLNHEHFGDWHQALSTILSNSWQWINFDT